jgi:hypothetical protein
MVKNVLEHEEYFGGREWPSMIAGTAISKVVTVAINSDRLLVGLEHTESKTS